MFAKRSKDPWKKYSCQDKNEEEKVQDLYNAVRDSRADVINVLVTKGGINVNGVHPEESKGQGLTALHLAARYDKHECALALIQHGAEVNAKDNFGFRPIHDAALNGCTQSMMVLLKHGATTSGVEFPPFRDLDFVTPMYYAIKSNSVSCLEALEAGESVEKFDTGECDRLIWGLGASNPTASLLQHARKYDFPDEMFAECVKNSAIVGNIKYFQALQEMAKGMDAGEFARKHGIVVIVSTQHGHHKYLDHVLNEKFDANVTNGTDESSALHFAARYGHSESIRLLVKHGGDVEGRNLDNFTPLHVALKGNNIEAVQELIAQGCDINASGGDTKDSAIHIALTTPVSPDTLRVLLDAKPKMVVRNAKHQLPGDVVQDKDGENSELYQTLLEYLRN